MDNQLKIQDNHVVEIDYTLTDMNGNLIDSSKDAGPLAYIQGMKNIIPALEKELEGRAIGEAFTVEIPCEQAYGKREEIMVQSVPKSEFPEVDQVQVGHQFQVTTQDGTPIIVTVIEIQDEHIVLDGNHPLADVDLKFSVEVKSIREATKDELNHGHVHADGGSCGHDH